MAELNSNEIAQLQNMVSQIRRNSDTLRAIWSDMVRHNDTSAYMTGAHSVAEINAALTALNGNSEAGYYQVADLALALAALAKTQTALTAAEKTSIVKLSHGV